MDTTKILAALTDGDLFGMATALSWDESRAITVTPPEAISDGGMLRVFIGRLGATVITVEQGHDDAVPNAKLHSHPSTEIGVQCFASTCEVLDEWSTRAQELGGTVVSEILALPASVPAAPVIPTGYYL